MHLELKPMRAIGEFLLKWIQCTASDVKETNWRFYFSKCSCILWPQTCIHARTFLPYKGEPCVLNPSKCIHHVHINSIWKHLDMCCCSLSSRQIFSSNVYVCMLYVYNSISIVIHRAHHFCSQMFSSPNEKWLSKQWIYDEHDGEEVTFDMDSLHHDQYLCHIIRSVLKLFFGSQVKP